MDGQRPFDLGSLRPGGASWMLDVTENSELVRRRGRWLSNKVMEIYLQEVAVATFLQKILPNQREKILCFAQRFESVLTLVLHYLDWAVPPSAWYYLMKAQRVEESGEEMHFHSTFQPKTAGAADHGDS